MAVAVVLCSVSCISQQQSLPATAARTYDRMDTFTTVTLVVESGRGVRIIDSAAALHALDGIDTILARWEEHFSQTGERSEVRLLNERRLGSKPLSPELVHMAALGQAYGDTTGGMFDITILPVKEGWGFGEKSSHLRIPDQSELDSLVALVGYDRFVVDTIARSITFRDEFVRMDVGGLAKGMALRDMGQFLDNLGIRSYLVVAGGDIICRGRRSPGRPWRIGIQHPRLPGRLLGTLPLENGSVVTSGDYERFYEQDGVRYHHIFNPETGRSCRGNRSVTIHAPDPVEADILSTGLYCLSAREIVAFVEARPRLDCVVVDSLGAVFVSRGWKQVVELN